MKTKFVMNDKVYDIDKSTIIAERAILRVRDFYNFIIERWQSTNDTGTIYQTKKGNYFLVTDTAAYVLTVDQVKDYLKHYNYEKYVELFGELEEA